MHFVLRQEEKEVRNQGAVWNPFPDPVVPFPLRKVYSSMRMQTTVPFAVQRCCVPVWREHVRGVSTGTRAMNLAVAPAMNRRPALPGGEGGIWVVGEAAF